jgi:biopolymer transport protein ExbD
LIPLIDVLLMLIIFFMVSSSFVEESRLKIQLPTADEKPAVAATDRIVVTVTQQGGYRVNERELVNSSRETLRAAVVRVAGDSRTASVVLRADARATHQSVITAMDVLGRMGFAQLNVATIEQPAASQK